MEKNESALESLILLSLFQCDKAPSQGCGPGNYNASVFRMVGVQVGEMVVSGEGEVPVLRLTSRNYDFCGLLACNSVPCP
jgi:hypothetical protein